jgi:hypothetical protein
MARTSTLPRRTQRSWLLLATVASAVVVVAAIVAAWAFFLRSSDTPARTVPAATSPSATTPGPRTDPFAVNEWAAATDAMLRYYEQHPECSTPSRPWTPSC